jgi:hypothetical protein
MLLEPSLPAFSATVVALLCPSNSRHAVDVTAGQKKKHEPHVVKVNY